MWLAAWKLVSNDAKRTIPPPKAKHSTLPQGCFLCLVFDYIHDSATMHNLCPGIFHRIEIWRRHVPTVCACFLEGLPEVEVAVCHY